MKKLNQQDLEQIKNHELSPEKVRGQLQIFEEGIPFVELAAPATLGNGIKKLDEKEVKQYSEAYENQNPDVVKFVPASGAATRMFKFLQVFQSDDLQGFENFVGLKSREEQKPLHEFFDRLPEFPFYKELLSKTKKSHSNFEGFSEAERKFALLKTLLDKYSTLPKGLIPFHKYPAGTRTAFEEHFAEAEKLGQNTKLHFTISEKHLGKFKKKSPPVPPKGGVNFSFQQKSTDTIAVDMQNRPFRDERGKLVFRPGGHGALLENLDQIDADIIFIKNIDNVSTEKNLQLIANHKKALAGILLETQAEAFQHLKNLTGFQNLLGLEKKAKAFLKEKLNIQAENIEEIKYYLNRPIRVCGMVKNTGAPGGGPFWVKGIDGKISLQIVETAQIDLENPQQKQILEKSTHFNPVDLVCGVRDYRGNKFDLSRFSNPKQGFITHKSVNGKEIKALELPGLWNGAMANWNTVFVEVPLETFNPVKTAMDLLKPGHRE